MASIPSSPSIGVSDIPNIIPILSGKGGVGKSSVTVQLALSLSLRGHNVGVLDIDLTGPSIPRLFGIEAGKVRQAPGGWLPVALDSSAPSGPSTNSSSNNNNTKRGSLHVMSLGFLLASRGDAVIWRGPKKTAMVTQLLSDTLWPRGTEYLLIDTPPGTSDEHISLMTALLLNHQQQPHEQAAAARIDASRQQQQRLAAVLVTTPQAIATADVKKELSFCSKVGLRVAGVLENMAGYMCPCCGEVTNVFSRGGGAVMARDWRVDFLGSVPLDAGDGWARLVEEGKRPRGGQSSTVAPANNNNKDGEEEEQDNDDATAAAAAAAAASSMADKYTACALYPIFADITSSVVRILQDGSAKLPSVPSTTTAAAATTPAANGLAATAHGNKNGTA